MASLLVASSQSTVSNTFIEDVIPLNSTSQANTNGTYFFLRNVRSITTTKTLGELGISGRTISELVSSNGATGLNAIVRPGTTFSVSGSVNTDTTGLGTTPTANTYIVNGEPYTDSDVSLSYPFPPFIPNFYTTSNHIAVASGSTTAGPGTSYGGTFSFPAYQSIVGYISGTTLTVTGAPTYRFAIMSGHVLTTKDLTVTTPDHIPITGTQIVSQLTGQLSGTGTISNYILTLSAAVTGLAIGSTITGSGVLPYTTIVAGSGTSWTISRSHSISSSTGFSFGGQTGTYSVSKSQTIGSSGSTRDFRIGTTYGMTVPMGIATEYIGTSAALPGDGTIGGGAYLYSISGTSLLCSFGSYANNISTAHSPRAGYSAAGLYYFCPTVWIPFVCNHASGNGPVQPTVSLYLLDTRTNLITFNQGVSVSSTTKKTFVGIALPNNVKQVYLPKFSYNKLIQNEITSVDKYKKTFSNKIYSKLKKSVASATVITMKEILDFSILSQSALVQKNDDELEIKSTSITDIKTTSVKQGGTTIIVSGSGGSADPYWS